MKYVRTYHMLVVHGHSPQKAAGIITDATRRDPWSLRWIRRVHAMQHRSLWIRRKQETHQRHLGQLVGYGASHGL